VPPIPSVRAASTLSMYTSDLGAACTSNPSGATKKWYVHESLVVSDRTSSTQVRRPLLRSQLFRSIQFNKPLVIHHSIQFNQP
jgi:hypothetical protein